MVELAPDAVHALLSLGQFITPDFGALLNRIGELSYSNEPHFFTSMKD